MKGQDIIVFIVLKIRINPAKECTVRIIDSLFLIFGVQDLRDSDVQILPLSSDSMKARIRSGTFLPGVHGLDPSFQFSCTN